MRLSTEDAIQKYQGNIYMAAFQICKNPEDAKDITQDTILQYHNSMTSFFDENHVKAWLIRVSINKAKDLTKSFWHRNQVAWEDYLDNIPFETKQEQNLLESVLRLPDKYRVAIHLYYYEEFSVLEIASLLKISESNVKVRLNRGRKLLKNIIEEEGNHADRQRNLSKVM